MFLSSAYLTLVAARTPVGVVTLVSLHFDLQKQYSIRVYQRLLLEIISCSSYVKQVLMSVA